uniref:Uncharacterized protein n=1 Tax=Helianthus annuus TaxID=4232 RepID=A0A251RTM4_HELAN
MIWHRLSLILIEENTGFRDWSGEIEDRRVSKVKATCIKNKEARLLKRKDGYANVLDAGHYKNQNLFKGLDEDTSNRLSSSSAISNSDSCMQFCSANASDLTECTPEHPLRWMTLSNLSGL